MPLDENFPTFLFSHPNHREPHLSTIEYTANGSPKQPVYTYTRSPEHANTYATTLADANFPSIIYASLTTSLELPPASPGASDPKVLLPADFTLHLYNPNSSVTVELKHSTLRGNFWEFTLPKRSFVPPTNAGIDAGYTPPVSEFLTFRWRKEGGALSRKQLRCSLVSPGNLPGAKRNAGAGEPDIPLAMYAGVGDKHGRGELVVYESNFQRVHLEDLKGLEMVLLLGARVINDIHFCPTATTFNTGGAVSVSTSSTRNRAGSSPLPPTRNPTPAPNSFPVQQQHPQHPQHSQHPGSSQQQYRTSQNAQNAPIPVPTPRPGPTPQDLARRKRDEAERAARIDAEQAAIRTMLATEEAREAAARQAAVDAETARLARLYAQSTVVPMMAQPGGSSRPIMTQPGRQSTPAPAQVPRPHRSPAPLRQTLRPHPSPPQPHVSPTQRTPTQPPRPAVVGGGGGYGNGGRVGSGYFGGATTLAPASAPTVVKRRSFLGLFGGGKEEGRKEEERARKEEERARKEEERAKKESKKEAKAGKKVLKKKSSMW
ncbi:hypothetical protein EDC01DRAFT_790970 [Geopyxis carbonaria]|nr:hypothetical protein EDC01DRAFT_790970 [Geopyxis carbonaria]